MARWASRTLTLYRSHTGRTDERITEAKTTIRAPLDRRGRRRRRSSADEADGDQSEEEAEHG
jgi:hypothetical protein